MVDAVREETWGTARDAMSPHPDFLAFGDGSPECVRVDHPDLRPIFFGLPTVGWEGDARMAVYSWPRMGRFILVRLEADGEYRKVRDLVTDKPLGPQAVGELCRWLVERDSRRGFDVQKYLADHNAAVDRERERAWDEQRGAAVDKLAWALKRDLAAHTGGKQFDHVVGDVPWHKQPEDS